jgi:hypothetical protein
MYDESLCVDTLTGLAATMARQDDPDAAPAAR